MRQSVSICVSALALAVGCANWAVAFDPAAALSSLSPNSAASLSGSLRNLVLEFLPTPLYENTKHWGGQKEVANGVTWKRKGIVLKPQVQKKMKNEGQWWKLRVDALSPRETLVLDLRDMHRPEKDKLLFTAFISMDTRAEYVRWHWRAGVRTYAASLRASARVRLTLRCEATTRVELKKSIPDFIFRLRVVESKVDYDNFKTEHVAGIGGELAELMGDAFLACMNQWRPSIERNLLEKANAAIVKGGDTKEIRISLSQILGQ